MDPVMPFVKNDEDELVNIGPLLAYDEVGVPNIFDTDSPESPSPSQRGSPRIWSWVAEMKSMEIAEERLEPSEKSIVEEGLEANRPIKIEPESPPESPIWMIVDELEQEQQPDGDGALADMEQDIPDPPEPILIRDIRFLLNGDRDDADSGIWSDETFEYVHDDGVDPDFDPQGK